jgi:sec-independent protein translocase protein TatC
MAGGQRMSFLDHLRELRKRLWIAALGFAVALTAAVIFRNELLAFIVEPLYRAWGAVPELAKHELQLHYASIVAPMFVQLKLAVYAALFLSAPLLVFQLWRFVAPGLYPREQRHVYPLLIGTFVFFIGGGVFGYLVVFPFGFEFLFRYGMDLGGWFPIEPTIMIDQYVDLAIGLLFAFGLVFELPLVIVFLARIGLVNHKQLLRFSRYFVVIAFAIGGVLTPTPDPLNQTLMAGPLIILYFAATLVAYFIGKQRREAARREEAGESDDDDDEPAG